jgi:hypothetical protein
MIGSISPELRITASLGTEKARHLTASDTLNEHLNLASLGRFPQVPRDVEQGSLEEKHEADPLVIPR